MRPKKGEYSRYQDALKTGFMNCDVHGRHDYITIFGNRRHARCEYCNRDKIKARRITYRTTAMLKDARQRAKKYAKEYSITFIDIQNLLESQGYKCALSGEEFDCDNIYCLDRIDSNLGYIKGNVQLVSYNVNCMKLDTPLEKFLFYCEKIYLRNQQMKHMGKVERAKGSGEKGGSTKARTQMAEKMDKAMVKKGERDEMKKSDKVNRVVAKKK